MAPTRRGVAGSARGGHVAAARPGWRPSELWRGPIRLDPAYPFHGNVDGPGQVRLDIAYTKDPVLNLCGNAQKNRKAPQILDSQVVAQALSHRGQLGGCRRSALHLQPSAAKPMAQTLLPSGYSGHVVPGAACVRPDRHAQGRWLAKSGHKARRSSHPSIS
jgi:hypothetical protein